MNKGDPRPEKKGFPTAGCRPDWDAKARHHLCRALCPWLRVEAKSTQFVMYLYGFRTATQQLFAVATGVAAAVAKVAYDAVGVESARAAIHGQQNWSRQSRANSQFSERKQRGGRRHAAAHIPVPSAQRRFDPLEAIIHADLDRVDVVVMAKGVAIGIARGVFTEIHIEVFELH